MYKFIYSEIRKAKKEYNCNSCEYLFEVSQRDALWVLDGEAKERYLELLRKGGKIRVGDFYVYEVCKFDGEICVLRYLPVAHSLCQALDCYPEF